MPNRLFFSNGNMIAAVAAAVVFWTGCLPCAALGPAQLLENAMKGGVYATPEKMELDFAETLFRKMFQGDFSGKLKSDWDRLGFDLVRLAHDSVTAWAVAEQQERKTGRGFFLIFGGRQSPRILQIPHGFKDLRTDTIGMKLTLEGDFAGAAWNTVPRYVLVDGKKIENDLADLYDTFLTAFARAFVRCRPDGFVMQIHGYSRAIRKSPAARKADMIVSAGVEYAPPWLRRLDRCLEWNLKAPTLCYPLETTELGGTKNSVGAALRSLGHNRFVHMEMSSNFRIELEMDFTLRKKLIDCVSDVLK